MGLQYSNNTTSLNASRVGRDDGYYLRTSAGSGKQSSANGIFGSEQKIKFSVGIRHDCHTNFFH